MAQGYNVEQFNDKVKQLLQSASVEFPVINARISRSALSLIKNRIINEGKNARGGSFGKYSTQPLPSFFFAGKGLSKSADDKINAELKRQRKAGIKVPGVSYEQWRQMNGLQTAHIDLKFTGETLKDIDLLETKTEGNIVTTIIASKDSISRSTGSKKKPSITTGQIADHLMEKFGDFLEVSKEEEEILIEAYDAELQQLVDETFGK